MNSSDLRAALARIVELQDLEDGWLDGTGTAVAESLLRQAALALAGELYALPAPYIYPTLESGVGFEWDGGSLLFSVSFEPEGSLVLAFPPLGMPGTEIEGGYEEVIAEAAQAVRDAGITGPARSEASATAGLQEFVASILIATDVQSLSPDQILRLKEAADL